MVQLARNLTDATSGFLSSLVHSRNQAESGQFQAATAPAAAEPHGEARPGAPECLRKPVVGLLDPVMLVVVVPLVPFGLVATSMMRR
jgi:hypothetical protein